MTLSELLQEKTGARLRLALEKLTDPPSDSVHWLTERIAKVNAKLQRRG